MKRTNFLLGKGERLISDILPATGGAPKSAPYTFEEAKSRIDPKLSNLVSEIIDLPIEACPRNLVVVNMTLNPEYVAKSYFPSKLLRSVGLEVVGSKAKKIIPEQRSKGRIPESTTTTELFVKGERASFEKWGKEIGDWTEYTPGASDLVEIEDLSFQRPESKMRSVAESLNSEVFEVVLHFNETLGEKWLLADFRRYLQYLGIDANFNRRFYAGGLCFLELIAPSKLADKIAQFSLVRVLRPMPALRFLKPIFRSSQNGIISTIDLPKLSAIDPSIKVAIFDGGVPEDHPINKWVSSYSGDDIGSEASELFEHGVGVTSAFLFGSISPGSNLERPYANVDHYRVLDNEPNQNSYELYQVLERIQNVLESNSYQFINLSLGPNLPIEDDEVHAWTAVLDQYLSDGTTLATIAVGNDGEGDESIGANRVQVPADCVNALGIGSCDSLENNWSRATYSSVGPGRSPGIVKPDLVDFGGTIDRPFITLDHQTGTTLIQTAGTSFSAPSVLRLATGIRAHFGIALNSLAIRSLLVHCSEKADCKPFEIGWGRVARNLEDMVITQDHVVRVVYQGRISASKYVRVPIPLPNRSLEGKVKIKATICFATGVDPHHSGNYTRSAIEVTFRPNKAKKNKVKPGQNVPLHPSSKPFFGISNNEFKTEAEAREDAMKWENCQHAERIFLAKSLNEPVFDIHYNARIDSHNDTTSQELSYAIIVTVEAPKVKDLYDQIVRRYPTQLEAIQPVIDIPIRI